MLQSLILVASSDECSFLSLSSRWHLTAVEHVFQSNRFAVGGDLRVRAKVGMGGEMFKIMTTDKPFAVVQNEV